jgi:hypothetical protein
VCGGIPYYLERFPDTCPLADCLLTEVFERTGLLHDEAELMLRQSIPDPANHIAVLRSIAHGHNRNSQIADRTGLTSAHITKILTSLERLGLAVTLRPVTASPRTKKTAYEIADQFLRFYYRFVEPAKSQLRTSALAVTYLNASVLPALDHHASKTWEQICQQHVLREAAGVTAVGRWWGQVQKGEGQRTEEREVDVVGVDGSGPASSGCGSPLKRWAPTPKPASGSDSHWRSKPRSSSHSQISGTRSGAARLRVQITVPPALHSWQHAPTVRSMSPRVMLPNTPQTSTRSAGAMSR